MKRIALVLRSIGERTAEAAKELATSAIAPDETHLIENVKPFSRAVTQMLQLDIRAETVVFMDADCLIFEPMRPFLERCSLPFVNCYGWDRFSGRAAFGVHITRMDVVQEMRRVVVADNDERYHTSPESRIRRLALSSLDLGKAFRGFRILHDFGQFYVDIFTKYAIRELRSRTGNIKKRRIFEAVTTAWPPDQMDFIVARLGIAAARRQLRGNKESTATAAFIEALPEIARQDLADAGIVEKSALSASEVRQLSQEAERRCPPRGGRGAKIFGIGLARTGTRRLAKALPALGYYVVHNPLSESVIDAVQRGELFAELLEDFDGLAGYVAATDFERYDEAFPEARFVLTVRSREAWIESIERHLEQKAISDARPGVTLLGLRRTLRERALGSCTFDRRVLFERYEEQMTRVKAHFASRPEKLLVFDPHGGDGWEALCGFLGAPVPARPFPSSSEERVLGE